MGALQRLGVGVSRLPGSSTRTSRRLMACCRPCPTRHLAKTSHANQWSCPCSGPTRVLGRHPRKPRLQVGLPLPAETRCSTRRFLGSTFSLPKQPRVAAGDAARTRSGDGMDRMGMGTTGRDRGAHSALSIPATMDGAGRPFPWPINVLRHLCVPAYIEKRGHFAPFTIAGLAGIPSGWFHPAPALVCRLLPGPSCCPWPVRRRCTAPRTLRLVCWSAYRRTLAICRPCAGAGRCTGKVASLAPSQQGRQAVRSMQSKGRVTASCVEHMHRFVFDLAPA